MADRYTAIVHSDFDRARVAKMAERIPQGWVATFAPPTRSLAQNDRMWAQLTDVSLARPQGRVHTPEIWKCLFMDAQGHKVKWVPSLDLESVVNVGFRSSRLTKPQMGDLMESISAFGAENGVVWSDPVDRQAA